MSYTVMEPQARPGEFLEIVEIPGHDDHPRSLDIDASALFIGRELHAEVLRRLLAILVFTPAGRGDAYYTARGRLVARIGYDYDGPDDADHYEWWVTGEKAPGMGERMDDARGAAPIEEAKAQIAQMLQTRGYVVRSM